MTFLDFFAGIGGFRLGMEMAGHTCVGHCEIDEHANRSYTAMHKPKEWEWYARDIRTVEPWDLPEAEVYCFGFPCQAFSISGKRRGFEDTRGTLFFEVMRLAKERHPRYLFAENVSGLLNHDGGGTFETIIRTMEELGYGVEWQVCNSKYFGVPQNRERVFIIGHLGGISEREIFPLVYESEETDVISRFSAARRGAESERISQVANTLTTRTDYGTNGTYILKQIGNIYGTKNEPNPSGGRVYSPDGLMRTLGAGHGMSQPLIGYEDDTDI